MRIARFATDGEPRFAAVGQDHTGAAMLAVLDGDPLYRPIRLTGETVPLAGARLVAPVLPRSKVVGVGRNYAAHAAELDHDVPAEPLLFLKPNTSVIGPDEPIVLPRQSQNVHHEAELAVVIGRVCRDVPRERVADVVFGYTCGNDVTARDLQERDGQWARAKGFDSFCPLGPWIETELDPSDVAITCTVNGEKRQASRTSLMVYDVAALVSYITEAFTLLPGDVVLTGTPAGVGPIVDGDEVTVAVEGLGELTNRVVTPHPDPVDHGDAAGYGDPNAAT
ncbi:MAG: fumarylacetoacetate hydrolase family protein [Jiangellaceae bacterium]|nr:fumarylacetoacetate hydrolase family protein [Jiangellaceae bacterium]